MFIRWHHHVVCMFAATFPTYQKPAELEAVKQGPDIGQRRCPQPKILDLVRELVLIASKASDATPALSRWRFPSLALFRQVAGA
jgi:hypothetical protein